MKILFVYKGRYHIRDSVTIEFLSAIAKKQGYSTDLVYEQDIFGVTDNIVSIPFLNKIFSDDNKIIKQIFAKMPDIVVFPDGFNRTDWNHKIAKRILINFWGKRYFRKKEVHTNFPDWLI